MELCSILKDFSLTVIYDPYTDKHWCEDDTHKKHHIDTAKKASAAGVTTFGKGGNCNVTITEEEDDDDNNK